ncbi:hypothetical protein EMCRGX_G021147 [Ephydatia muelleri]
MHVASTTSGVKRRRDEKDSLLSSDDDVTEGPVKKVQRTTSKNKKKNAGPTTLPKKTLTRPRSSAQERAELKEEGTRGKDASKEGIRGKDAGKEGIRGKDAGKEGIRGKDAGKEGIRGKDAGKEGIRGKDAGKEGIRGKDAGKEGTRGKDAGKEGTRGKDVGKGKVVSKRARASIGAAGAKNRTSGGRTLTKVTTGDTVTKEVTTREGDAQTKEVATREGDAQTKEVATHEGDTMTKEVASEVADCDAMSMEAALPCAPEEGCWRHYKELCSWLPGRQKQVELLLTIFGEPSSVVYPSLYVWGHSGTGKTLVIQSVLKKLQVQFAFVSCIDCYTPQLLFESALRQITATHSDPMTGRCDSMAKFVRVLSQVLNECGPVAYLVLDKAERVRDMEPTLLPSLMRLAELTRRRVCVILISELVWGKFYSDPFEAPSFILHFPNYNKEETLALMGLDCPPDKPSLFYHTFINHIWNVFNSVCRDLSELRHLSTILYPKYCEPVDQDKIGIQETRRLWRHIEPYFKHVMSKIFLREMSSAHMERMQLGGGGTSQLQSGTKSLELPYVSKFLLMAAYLASYNPARMDRRFFSKRKGDSKKSKRKVPKDKPSCQLQGPKPFPLDRMMAVFYSIMEDCEAPSTDVYSQISSLVTMQLVAQVGNGCDLDNPRYKCLVNLDFIRAVSRSVGFDIVQYLYDFV